MGRVLTPNIPRNIGEYLAVAVTVAFMYPFDFVTVELTLILDTTEALGAFRLKIAVALVTPTAIEPLPVIDCPAMKPGELVATAPTLAASTASCSLVAEVR